VTPSKPPTQTPLSTALTIGKMAQGARERAGLSLDEAARILKMTTRYLRRIERGNHPISFNLREEMRRVYGSFQPSPNETTDRPIQNRGGERKDTGKATERETSYLPKCKNRAGGATLRPVSPDTPDNRFAVSTNSIALLPEGEKDNDVE
jgi:transcriptional regulator with XRE-family HTH domain